MAQEPKPEQAPPAPAPREGEDEVMAIRRAAGSIAEVIDNPNQQPQRVRIG